MGRVLCYGVVGVDRLLQVTAYPEANGHARVRREETVVGGEAANTAVRLAQLGVPVTLMGNPVGNDPDGRLFRDTIGRYAVDCRVETADGPTGHAFVISDDRTRTIFGAFGKLSGPTVPDDLWPALAMVTVDPFVSGAVAAAAGARERGLPVLAIEVEPDHDLAGLSDTVINSAGFLRRHQAGDPADIAAALLDRGVGTVIVTRGADGADIYDGEGVTRVPAFPVEAVDTTGAGDAFRAGWIAAALAGESREGCSRLASAVAAVSCGFLGGCGGKVSLEAASALGRPA